MMDLLYEWPSSAKFGRVIPKTKFYENASMTAKVKEKFISEVQRIVWAYKISDSTVNVRAGKDVSEIQIFRIDIKGEDVRNDVLATIDQAIDFPIIYEIERSSTDGPQVRLVAGYKQVNANKNKVGQYLSTNWMPSTNPRLPLPVALDLDGLYEGLMQPLLPIPARQGESMSESSDRLVQVEKLEREMKALEIKLRNEKQFNRKIEIRRELRERTDMYESIVIVKRS